MEGNEYYELFGVPAPEEGENGQSVADSGAADPEKGENEQEVAEPVNNAPEGEMPAEERHKQAEERRRKEAQKRQEEINDAVNGALEKQRKENEAVLSRVFQRVALVDRHNGNKPVTTAEEFEAWDRAQRAADLQKDLQDGKLTPEGLQEVLATMPEVKQILDRAQKQEEAAKEAEQRAGAETFAAKREMELAEIRKINPAIKSLDDIVSMQTGKAFISYVQRGNTFLEAYRLANYDDILASRREAGAQAARNAAAGKSHMQQTAQQGDGGKRVPRNVADMYRLLNPEMSEAEIVAHYNGL